MIRSIARKDEGFSVAEVVIAAAILFFVLTAMIGLVGASQRMSVDAKRRTIVTNAMAEYIDEIRAMDYKQIAMYPTGGIRDTDPRVYGNYTVTFKNRVVFQDGANGEYLRTIYVSASCTINGQTFTSSSTVNIKNPANDTTAAKLTDPDAPVIKFTTATAKPDSVLYAKRVNNTTYDLNEIGVEVRSPNDAIQEVQFKVGNVLVRDDQSDSGHDAIWTFTPPRTGAFVVTSVWDTEQDGVSDGFQTLRAIAKDDKGLVSSVDRRFIVDNEVPGVPTDLAANATTSRAAAVAFNAAPDPVPPSGGIASTFATRYEYTLRKEPLGYSSSVDSWSVVGVPVIIRNATSDVAAMQKGGRLSIPLVVEPFSRYSISLKAGSPRDFNATPGVLSVPLVSRAEAVSATCTTNYVKTGNSKYTDYTLQILVTRPSFPVSSVTYVFEYKDPATGEWLPFEFAEGWTATTGSTSPYVSIAGTFTDTQASRQLWLRVGMTVTPSGPGGGTPLPVNYTNAFGRTPLDSDSKSGVKAGPLPLSPDPTWAE